MNKLKIFKSNYTDAEWLERESGKLQKFLGSASAVFPCRLVCGLSFP